MCFGTNSSILSFISFNKFLGSVFSIMSFSTFKQKADSYYEFLCDEETDL